MKKFEADSHFFFTCAAADFRIAVSSAQERMEHVESLRTEVEEAAVRTFIEVYGGWYVYVRYILGRYVLPCDLDDLCQDVFLRLWRYRHRLHVARDTKESLKGYIRVVAHNEARRQWRRRQERDRARPTVTAIARYLGVSRQTIYNWRKRKESRAS